MRGLALKFTNTHQTENPHGFSEVGEDKQLLIAIVVWRFYIRIFPFDFSRLHDLCNSAKLISSLFPKSSIDCRWSIS